MISYESAHDCWRPRYIEMDHFVREDVDLVVIFGRMDDAKLGLKLKKRLLNTELNYDNFTS